jgi:hypothetical protein
MLPDYDRAGRIGEFYRSPATRSFAELLIDAEEDPYLLAVAGGLIVQQSLSLAVGNYLGSRRGPPAPGGEKREE